METSSTARFVSFDLANDITKDINAYLLNGFIMSTLEPLRNDDEAVKDINAYLLNGFIIVA